MKSILIISGTFYPHNSPRSFRTTELAKEFSRLGHAVTVLVPENRKNEEMCQFAKTHQIDLKFFGPLSWNNFDHSKFLGDWSRKFGRVLQLFLHYPEMEIYYKLVSYLKQMKASYDVVLSIAVPHQIHWAVAKVNPQKKFAKFWIADCGDPFMGNRLDTIRAPFYFHYFENNFLKTADVVTVPIAGAIPAYNAKFQHKLKVIPQGFDFEGISLQTYKKGNIPRFAYAGGVSLKGARSPYQLIHYLLSIEKNFEFHIYSHRAMSLAGLAEKSNGRLVLHQSIPRNELIPELSKMDFLINFDNNLSTALPSKLIDYSLAKRPILNITPNDLQTENINEFLAGNFKNQYKIKNIEQYNIKKVVQRFLKFIP